MRFLIEAVVWWLLLVGVWVVTLSSAPPTEMYVAGAASLVCAVAVAVARRAMRASWSPQLRWVRWFLLLPVSVIIDTPRVWWAALRHAGHDGAADADIRKVQLQRRERVARAAARRALGNIAVSATPATFVVDVDPDEDALLVHSLVAGTPSIERAVGK